MGKMERLREALAAKVADEFEVGDVIRWTAAGKWRYAAIKTEAGWFTTARWGNGFVSDNYDYEGLIEVLNRSEVSEVEVATGWEEA